MKNKPKRNRKFRLLLSAFKHRPMFFLIYAIRIIAAAALPFLSIFAVKLIIDELTAGQDVRLLLTYAVVYCVAALVLNYAVGAIKLLGERYGDDFDRYFNRLLCEKAMSLEYYDIEDPNVLYSIEKAKNGISGMSGGVQGLVETLFDLIANIITVLGVVSIIVLNTPWLLLISVIPTVIRAFYTSRINAVNFEAQQKMTEVQRVYSYLFINLPQQKYAKDIRLYNAGEFLADKTDGYIREGVDGIMKEQAAKREPLDVKGALLKTASQLGGYIYLGCLLVTKVLTFGNFSMLISSASTLDLGISGAIERVQQLSLKRRFARDYIDFMNRPLSLNTGRRTMPDTTEHTIEFRNVSFRYPRSNAWTLRNIHLRINSGEKIAIVGLNGAGKTTLIKLLCGLYKPDEGNILVDGIDIEYYDKERYHELFSVVFQDFSLQPYGLGENIAITSSVTDGDREKIEEIAQTINFTDKLRKFPEGIDTTLFKLFDDHGVEPSGGEQQKIAIARALYKDAPIIILDEPTAALDPIAENEIYSNFDSLVGSKTAIYISHRMSSTRFCDRIIVLENGSIAESGSHEKLMANGGLYAKMFSSQAQFYN